MSKPRVLFIDVTCPKPYDETTIAAGGLGGSEATCVRVAEGLAGRGYSVTVSQHCRETAYTSAAGVDYKPLKGPKVRAEVVVVLREPKMMEFIYSGYRASQRILWLHDLNIREVALDPDMERIGKLDIVCVSDWHTQVVQDAFLTMRRKCDAVRVRTVKNPVDDSLRPDETPVDPYKLVFFSSPHKGLDRALYLFSCLRRIDSRYTFHIANPGYYPDAISNADGVHLLGALSHAAAIQHVRSALAVFHCNATFPETFGLVYAEAHAVGTPCLTANLGAVRELLGREELIDVSSEERVVARITSWTNGERPRVGLSPDVRLSAVLDRWEEVIRAY